MLGASVCVDISVIGDVMVWYWVVLYVDGAKVLMIVLQTIYQQIPWQKVKQR